MAYVEVLGIKIVMLDVEVLLGHEYTLYRFNSISMTPSGLDYVCGYGTYRGRGTRGSSCGLPWE